MTKNRQVASSPINLLDLVWSSTNRAVGHSWERLNHAMRESLTLAIGAGFEFAEGDVKYIMRNYRSGYWIGDPEWIYVCAIRSNNMSAIKSFESWCSREPFIAESVNLNAYGMSNPFQHGGCGDRQKSRLAVGFSFLWNGQKAKVTSFAKDQQSFTACSYKKTSQHSEKIDKRYTITHTELLQGRAFDRERKSLLTRANAAPDEVRKQIVDALKVKSEAEFAATPIERVRKVVDKYAPAAAKPKRCIAVIITQEHIGRAVDAGAGCQSRTYKPGMRSTEISADHRVWLIKHAPELAAELGFST